MLTRESKNFQIKALRSKQEIKLTKDKQTKLIWKTPSAKTRSSHSKNKNELKTSIVYQILINANDRIESQWKSRQNRHQTKVNVCFMQVFWSEAAFLPIYDIKTSQGWTPENPFSLPNAHVRLSAKKNLEKQNVPNFYNCFPFKA